MNCVDEGQLNTQDISTRMRHRALNGYGMQVGVYLWLFMLAEVLTKTVKRTHLVFSMVVCLTLCFSMVTMHASVMMLAAVVCLTLCFSMAMSDQVGILKSSLTGQFS